MAQTACLLALTSNNVVSPSISPIPQFLLVLNSRVLFSPGIDLLLSNFRFINFMFRNQI